MAWRCSAVSNDGLVDNLTRAGIIQSQRVARAMKATDRALYVTPRDDPEGARLVSPAQAYQDAPQPLGFGQTISAPHMHASALEFAHASIRKMDHPRVLDVGAGSGYLTACLGNLVESDGGRVFGIECIPQLVQLAQRNIERANGELMRRGVVSIKQADGWTGLPAEAPFHFIHVGAAAVEPPQALMEQLAQGGRLVVPVGAEGSNQVLVEIHRTDEKSFTTRELMNVSFVPLVRQRTELSHPGGLRLPGQYGSHRGHPPDSMHRELERRVEETTGNIVLVLLVSPKYERLQLSRQDERSVSGQPQISFGAINALPTAHVEDYAVSSTALDDAVLALS
ncbi:hypothetical protein PsorP6_011074 [Peronosclerospora sorghi]|uniref:Uncharacterized protein n=1 Tax=Peronosclerospora sorghi TaxID=230839 RepID=A0ACC0VVQ5_9STRA|nr:hypothetical protein PsorP6_011074 [Peronosclerospora sorghi]